MAKIRKVTACTVCGTRHRTHTGARACQAADMQAWSEERMRLHVNTHGATWCGLCRVPMTTGDLALFWSAYDGTLITGTPPDPVCPDCDGDYDARADFLVEAEIDLDELLDALTDPQQNGEAAITDLLDDVAAVGDDAEGMTADLIGSLTAWDAGHRPTIPTPTSPLLDACPEQPQEPR